MDRENLRYRRKLPHWRQRNAVYFVRFSLARDQHGLDPEERDLVAGALRYFDQRRYELLAWVVMDNHVHVLVSPFDRIELEKVLHSWKSWTNHQMVEKHGRQSPVWREESWDRVVRDALELTRFTRYIVNNPVKRWRSHDYRWLWHGGLGA